MSTESTKSANASCEQEQTRVQESHTLRIIGNIFIRPDELFAHDASIVDKVGRRRASAARREQCQDIVVQHWDRQRMLNRGHTYVQSDRVHISASTRTRTIYDVGNIPVVVHALVVMLGQGPAISDNEIRLTPSGTHSIDRLRAARSNRWRDAL